MINRRARIAAARRASARRLHTARSGGAEIAAVLPNLATNDAKAYIFNMPLTSISPLPLPKKCDACPRFCGADRAGGETGFCGAGGALTLASASIHFGEEPPVSGAGGSGAIFVSGCALRCDFCQNFQISRGFMGRAVSEKEFAGICLKLRDAGAENINIVTGSHYIEAIIAGLKAAKNAGLKIPVVWNSSSYETEESIVRLKDYVDLFLPDLKTLSPDLSRELFHAPDYPRYAEAAILKMLDTKPGRVIIRHLVLPANLDSTFKVIEWFARNAKTRARFSLLTQYTPVETGAKKSAALARSLTKAEYDAVIESLESFDIDGWYQEFEDDASWLPDFTRENPFLSEKSRPIWHWKKGFI